MNLCEQSAGRHVCIMPAASAFRDSVLSATASETREPKLHTKALILDLGLLIFPFGVEDTRAGNL